MPDQTPERLTDDELRADMANGWAPHAAQLAAELLAARARITELEARNANLDKAFRSAADQAAELATDAYERTQAEEAAQTPREPDAYIAVQRYHSPNAEGPEWNQTARIMPAGDYDAEDREWFVQHGFELLPIAADGDGTRWAAAQQSDPVGYAVVVENEAGRFVQYSSLLPKSVAVDRAEYYRAELGMRTRAVELRELRDAE